MGGLSSTNSPTVRAVDGSYVICMARARESRRESRIIPGDGGQNKQSIKFGCFVVVVVVVVVVVGGGGGGSVGIVGIEGMHVSIVKRV
jgi:hypothetical protein